MRVDFVEAVQDGPSRSGSHARASALPSALDHDDCTAPILITDSDYMYVVRTSVPSHSG